MTDSDPTPTDLPTFVVVGNVNQGKSSIVRTLTEQTDVPVDSFPGTTSIAGRYVFRNESGPLFELIDTPGFQEPRRVLRWLRDVATSPAERPGAIRRFVEEHRKGDRFSDECELLAPIVDGAGILYVVDASASFQPANEAEMEILRWTGRPAMALLNRIPATTVEDGETAAEVDAQDAEVLAEWRDVLTQYFNAVREFDAHRASFRERIALFRAFAELRDDWRPRVERAVTALEDDRRDRRRRTAGVIAELIATATGHVESHTLKEGDDVEQIREELRTRHRETLSNLETESWREVERIHGWDQLERDIQERPADLELGLFDRRSLQVFGLSRAELLKTGAITGGLSGGAIDAAVGGLSFGTGLVIGAVTGAAGGWFGGRVAAESWSKKLPSLPGAVKRGLPGRLGRSLEIPFGEVQQVGPADTRLAWVLLERSLVHARAIATRAHAKTGRLETEQLLPAVRRLRTDWPGGGDWQRAVETEIQETIDAAKKRSARGPVDALTRLIDRALERLEDDNGGTE